MNILSSTNVTKDSQKYIIINFNYVFLMLFHSVLNLYANTLSDLNSFESLSAYCLSTCLTDIPRVAKP